MNRTFKVGPLRALACGLALAVLGSAAQAQMYSWKDAKGVTHFSDQPPPATEAARAGPVQAKKLARGDGQPALPYDLNEAARRNPVVLYTTSACEACDEGRSLLQQRGIPFSEKTVQSNDDQQQLKAAGSDARLPLLLVGATRQIGFQAQSWQEALTAANYPLQSRLPTGWRQPAAAAAAPVPAQVAREEPARPEPTPQKPPPANAPPGFQF